MTSFFVLCAFFVFIFVFTTKNSTGLSCLVGSLLSFKYGENEKVVTFWSPNCTKLKKIGQIVKIRAIFSLLKLFFMNFFRASYYSTNLLDSSCKNIVYLYSNFAGTSHFFIV